MMTNNQATAIKDALNADHPTLAIKGMHINVYVQDVRQVYNRVDVYVNPVAGTGASWFDINSLSTSVDLDKYL